MGEDWKYFESHPYFALLDFEFLARFFDSGIRREKPSRAQLETVPIKLKLQMKGPIRVKKPFPYSKEEGLDYI